jgi:peptide/nickel transport system permease protein
MKILSLFKPSSTEAKEQEKKLMTERMYTASQAQLIFWRFRKHRLAIIALVVLVLLYLSAIFAGFVGPYRLDTRFKQQKDAPPSTLHWSHRGKFIGPFVYDVKQVTDPDTFRRTFVEEKETPYRVRLFMKGDEYNFWGLFPANIHLFAVEDLEIPFFVFGSDSLGRDIFSRIIHGSRISLTIGLIGVFVSFFFGIFLGGLSGFLGGIVDNIIQRIIEFILSLPQIPLWMSLAAAMPRDWPATKSYFFITLILSLVGWCRLARVVRGKVMSLANEDYVVAANLFGSSMPRTMFVHLIPAFFSHLIVSMTLAIPGMILGETALSFLGLGMQPPAVSWGVLLQDAQKIQVLAQAPWKLIPCAFVVVAVLMFNFLGDGLRDAADPYESR